MIRRRRRRMEGWGEKRVETVEAVQGERVKVGPLEVGESGYVVPKGANEEVREEIKKLIAADEERERKVGEAFKRGDERARKAAEVAEGVRREAERQEVKRRERVEAKTKELAALLPKDVAIELPPEGMKTKVQRGLEVGLEVLAERYAKLMGTVIGIALGELDLRGELVVEGEKKVDKVLAMELVKLLPRVMEEVKSDGSSPLEGLWKAMRLKMLGMEVELRKEGLGAAGAMEVIDGKAREVY